MLLCATNGGFLRAWCLLGGRASWRDGDGVVRQKERAQRYDDDDV